MIITREAHAPEGYSDDARWTRRKRLSRNIRAIVVFVVALFALSIVNRYFMLHPLNPLTAKEWVDGMVESDPKSVGTFCTLYEFDSDVAGDTLRSVGIDNTTEPRAIDIRVEIMSRC